MTNSFRIDASEVRGWRAALGERMAMRGVPAIAKEMEAALATKSEDGTVVLSRHQLFTWTEALDGVAMRENDKPIANVVSDMRSILTGKIERTFRSTLIPLGPRAGADEITVTETPPARTGYVPPPPVVYSRNAASAPISTSSVNAGASRALAGVDLTNAIMDVMGAAQRELYVASPWTTGVETLVNDLARLPPQVQVKIVSRRPEKDDAAFHQAMDQLGRRRAITAWSPFIQTRMMIADDTRAIVGAASLPGPASREIGVYVTDAATIAALRAHFERSHAEATGGR